jgi:hypothetical protein
MSDNIEVEIIQWDHIVLVAETMRDLQFELDRHGEVGYELASLVTVVHNDYRGLEYQFVMKRPYITPELAPTPDTRVRGI